MVGSVLRERFEKHVMYKLLAFKPSRNCVAIPKDLGKKLSYEYEHETADKGQILEECVVWTGAV